MGVEDVGGLDGVGSILGSADGERLRRGTFRRRRACPRRLRATARTRGARRQAAVVERGLSDAGSSAVSTVWAA